MRFSNAPVCTVACTSGKITVVPFRAASIAGSLRNTLANRADEPIFELEGDIQVANQP